MSAESALATSAKTKTIDMKTVLRIIAHLLFLRLRAIALALRLLDAARYRACATPSLQKRKARGNPHARWFREIEVSRRSHRWGCPWPSHFAPYCLFTALH